MTRRRSLAVVAIAAVGTVALAAGIAQGSSGSDGDTQVATIDAAVAAADVRLCPGAAPVAPARPRRHRRPHGAERGRRLAAAPLADRRGRAGLDRRHPGRGHHDPRGAADRALWRGRPRHRADRRRRAGAHAEDDHDHDHDHPRRRRHHDDRRRHRPPPGPDDGPDDHARPRRRVAARHRRRRPSPQAARRPPAPAPPPPGRPTTTTTTAPPDRTPPTIDTFAVTRNADLGGWRARLRVTAPGATQRAGAGRARASPGCGSSTRSWPTSTAAVVFRGNDPMPLVSGDLYRVNLGPFNQPLPAGTHGYVSWQVLATDCLAGAQRGDREPPAQTCGCRSGTAERASVLGLEDRGHRGHDLAVAQGHDPDTGGIATLAGDLADLHADHGAAAVDDEDLVVERHHERGDHVALLGRELDAPNALATAALAVEVLELGALAVAGVGDHEHGDVVAAGVERHDLVAGPHLHAPHAGGRPPHVAHVVLAEADGLAQLGQHEDVVAPVGGDDLDQLVAVLEVDGDDARAQRRVVLVELRLLHLALLGGEEEERLGLVVAGVDDRLDVLVGLELEQVDDRRAARGALLLGDLVRLEAVDPSQVAEEQQVGVGGGGEDVGDVVVVAEVGAGDALAASAL